MGASQYSGLVSMMMIMMVLMIIMITGELHHEAWQALAPS